MTAITIDRDTAEEWLEGFVNCDTGKDLVGYAIKAATMLRAALASPAPERKPMTHEEVIDLVRECGLDWHKGFVPLFDSDPTNRFAVLVRAVEDRYSKGTP